MILRCTWCQKEQRLDLGTVYGRTDAEFFLHMMTGGWCGKPPPGMTYQPVSGNDVPPGGTAAHISQCCEKQIEGELYGYADPEVP